METLTKMKTSWSFWYHSSKVRDWSRDSYVFLYKTQYAEEFWGVFKLFTQKHFESGIIFIMKDNVFPDWSSPENKNGGFISIKVDTRGKHYSLVHVLRTWIERMISRNNNQGCTHSTWYIIKSQKWALYIKVVVEK